MIIFSPVLFGAASYISPHIFYSTFTAVALLCMALMIKEKNLTFWYITIFFIALATLSLEYAPLLIITFILSIYLNRKSLFHEYNKRRFLTLLFKSIAVYLSVIIFLWPAGIVKLSLVKNYLFFTYFTLIRGQDYGTQNFISAWIGRCRQSPVEIIAVIVSLGATFFLLKQKKWLVPFVVYCMLILLTTMRNASPSPTYISSLVMTGLILFGFIVAYVPGVNKAVKYVIVFAVIALNVLSFLYIFQPSFNSANKREQEKLDKVIELIESQPDENILIFRDFLPTIHYYIPHKKFDSYRQIKEVEALIQVNKYRGILYAGKEKKQVLEIVKAQYPAVKYLSLFLGSVTEDDVVYYTLF